MKRIAITMYENISAPLVLTSGHFIYFHSGHARLLEHGSKLGRVVVALNGDYWHSAKYGANAVPVANRKYLVESCKYVDHVIVFDEQTPAELIMAIKPQYFIKGPEYKNTVLPEQYACDSVNCKIVFTEGIKENNSSDLLLLK
jgi:bifunctional ADP-heptose synthase (sugar kinase/adenylyltransferase)